MNNPYCGLLVPSSELPVSSPLIAAASGGCSPPGIAHTPSGRDQRSLSELHNRRNNRAFMVPASELGSFYSNFGVFI